MGQWKYIFDLPQGAAMANWIQTVPNDGIIRYLDFLNSEVIFPTSAKALGEILTVKSDEFIKPPAINRAVKDFLGSGLLFSEGEDHKVCGIFRLRNCLETPPQVATPIGPKVSPVEDSLWGSGTGLPLNHIQTEFTLTKLSLFQAQRKNLMPAFSFRHIKALYPTFWAKSCEFLGLITAEVHGASKGRPSPSSVVDISAWFSRVALDILGTAGLGHDFRAMTNTSSELTTTYSKVFRPSKQMQILVTLNIFFPRWFVKSLPFTRNKELQQAAVLLRKTCRSLIHEKRLKMQETKRADADILSVAIESGGFTDDDLVDQLLTFLPAGHETTAAAAAWGVCLLAQHPDIQFRLRADVRAQLPSPLTPQSSTSPFQIDQIPYLHAVCNEVLRFCPPASLTYREVASHGTTLLNEPIPKGTRVVVCPLAINRDPAHWGPDAGVFNPERWTGPGKANSGGALSNYSFMTFLHGPRNCIGTSFAKTEFAFLLAVIVGRFDMELEDPSKELTPSRGVTMKPADVGIRLRVLDGW
ncbi:hypothetical protein GP486_000516 [Trichoglossum hirsutum]|uniref:Cytochrome P450 monooxygenase n=1 Tax=Trichoglossum hirsutum TaxID=265104 RepID=A0A9P8LIR7_9PEZI|nr:hypothetical protein GP486_000516 [Trichoglossum hirsutum]